MNNEEIRMDYGAALEWLYTIRRFGPKRTLQPTRHIMELLDNPQNNFKIIHIGGTNGKGSTSAITANILRHQGYKTGLFTSPHLENFTERIQVNGQEIQREDVARIITRIAPLFEQMLDYPEPMPLRFFDIVTALAFVYFNEQKVDYAVLEVGLGGRLDATNIIIPVVSVITNIGYEHTNILGDTLEEIAFEKAGIIKPDTTLVTATQDPQVLQVFQREAENKNTQTIQIGDQVTTKTTKSDETGQRFTVTTPHATYQDLHIPLIGAHQVANAATAIAAVEAAHDPVTDLSEAIRKGLADVYWPGRLEIIHENPLIVLDCAKDGEATEAVRKSIYNFKYAKLVSVVSISSDKKHPAMMRNISQISDHVILTKHSVMNRATDPQNLADLVTMNGVSNEIVPQQEKAFKKAVMITSPSDMVLVIGSVFLVGDARAYYRKHYS